MCTTSYILSDLVVYFESSWVIEIESMSFIFLDVYLLSGFYEVPILGT